MAQRSTDLPIATHLTETDKHKLPIGQHSSSSSALSSRGGQTQRHLIKRRYKPQPNRRPNDVYICGKVNYSAAVEKCKKLLDGDFNQLFLHGIEAAIPTTVSIATQLKKFYQGTVDFSTTTGTEILIDDLIPLDDFSVPTTQSRKVSTIEIHVYRTIGIPEIVVV